MRAFGGVGLVLLAILHQDVWFWSSQTRWFGLPIGLTYHVGLCLLASVVAMTIASSVVLVIGSLVSRPPEDDRVRRFFAAEGLA